MIKLFSTVNFLFLLYVCCSGQNYSYVDVKYFPQLQNTNISCITLNGNSKTLFFCTQSGVFEFDGMRCKEIKFGVDENSLLDSRSVQKLYFYEGADYLFALISNAGLAILNTSGKKSYFQTLRINEISKQDQFLGVEKCRENYLVATSGGLFLIAVKWDEKKKMFEAIIIDNYKQVKPELVTKVTSSSFAILERSNTMTKFAITPGGKIIKEKTLVLPLYTKNIKEYFTLTHQDDIFNIGTNQGLFQIEITNGVFKLKNNYITNQSIYSILQKKAGGLTIAASNGLYELKETGELIQVKNNSTEINNDILSTVYNLFDDGNNTWLATQSGLAMYSNLPTPYFKIINTNKQNKPLNHVYHINKDVSSNLIISSENGLYRYNKKTGLSIIKDGLTFFLSFADPSGNQIASSLTTSYVIKKGKLIPIEKMYPEFKAIVSPSFNDVENIGNSQLLLSTENEQGLYIWNYQKKTVNRIEKYLNIPVAINQINSLYKYNSKIFILTDSVFWEYENDRLIKHNLTKQSKSYGVLFDMVKVGDYYYFSSYDNGLIKTDPDFNIKYIYNKANGLSDNGVYRMLPVGDSAIMLSTNKGINYINLATNSIKILNQEDGLNTDVFEEFSSFEANNIFYFGGNGGVTEIDISKLNFKVPENNLFFRSFSLVDDRNEKQDFELIKTNKIIIPNNVTQTSVAFQNVIYPLKNKNKYAYKINEIHSDWLSLDNQNFITLIGLSPGTYHLQVKAANEDGVWSEPKELVLIFLPKWYQTWWFYLLIALTVAGILYALYRYRISQIKKQHEIRKNIATDLHDDLGSTLNSVKVFTNLAISGVKQEESLQQIKDNLNEATMGLRDMIWVLDDSLDTVDELVTRLKQFAIPVASASNIQAEIKAESEVNNLKLTKEEKRNLFLVCKEAINNSIKYSGATQINVDIKPDGKKIRITIADNGKGFDMNTVKKGYGLKNMQYRSGQVRYKAILTSEPGAGTKLVIEPA